MQRGVRLGGTWGSCDGPGGARADPDHVLDPGIPGNAACLLAIAIVAKTESGNTLTGYYNADAQDKAVFAHHIQSDIVLDIIKANAAEIKAMMEGVDDGTD